MISDIISSFIGTLAFSILYNVDKKFYFYCGLTGTAGWLCYRMTVDFSSPAVASFYWNVNGCFAFTNFFRMEEMSDYRFSDFGNFSACAGGKRILYGILFCYGRYGSCLTDGNFIN